MKAVYSSPVKMATVASMWLLVICGGVDAGFRFGTPRNLGPVVNSSSSDGSPEISPDGLSLYFDSGRPAGRGDWDIWVSKRTPGDDWGAPVPLAAPINGPYADSGPSLSADGLSLYFASNRVGGLGSFDLYVATRPSPDAPWGPPTSLGPVVNSTYYDNHPSISADGLSLYFGSNRSGGEGYDIWVTKRTSLGSPWGPPVNLGWTINGPGIEMSPYIFGNDLILFWDSRITDRDLCMARRRRPDEPWQPVPGLTALNTWDWETDPSVAADGSMLYVATYWSGGSGGQDLWQVPIEAVVDLNDDGIVNFRDFSFLARHWQQEELSVDVGPTPLGDWRVDGRDLAAFVEHWLQDCRLLAHWKLDETAGTHASDSVGDNDATVMGTPLWWPDGGRIGGALELNGVTHAVTGRVVHDPSAGPFSVFAWVKGGAPGQVILSQDKGADWLMADPVAGALRTDLRSPQVGGRFIPPEASPLVCAAVITDGDWHRVGFVRDGDARILYVDDMEVARDTAINLIPAAGGLRIGAGNKLESGTFWTGLIDDVRIYNRAVQP